MRAFRITVSAAGDWACACDSGARASKASKVSFTGSFPGLTKDFPFFYVTPSISLLQVCRPKVLCAPRHTKRWAEYFPTAPRSHPGRDFSSDAAWRSRNKNCRRVEVGSPRPRARSVILPAECTQTPRLRGYKILRCQTGERCETGAAP